MRTRPARQHVGPPRVVILGGGFGGLYTALKLDALTWPDASKRPVVTLVDRAERFVFKPMLYELVNETMSDWEVAPAFEDLLKPTSVRYVRGDVAAVRTGDEVPFADGSTGSSGGGTIELASGETVEYDWLVVAVGTASADAKCPGSKDFAIPLSTLEDARRLAGAMRDVEAAFETDRAAAATGGGRGGRRRRRALRRRARGRRRREARGQGERRAVRVRGWDHAGVAAGPARRGEEAIGRRGGDHSSGHARAKISEPSSGVPSGVPSSPDAPRLLRGVADVRRGRLRFADGGLRRRVLGGWATRGGARVVARSRGIVARTRSSRSGRCG